MFQLCLRSGQSSYPKWLADTGPALEQLFEESPTLVDAEHESRDLESTSSPNGKSYQDAGSTSNGQSASAHNFESTSNELCALDFEPTTDGFPPMEVFTSVGVNENNEQACILQAGCSDINVKMELADVNVGYLFVIAFRNFILVIQLNNSSVKFKLFFFSVSSQPGVRREIYFR